MHCNDKYNHNRFYDDVTYNIFNLTFSLYYKKCYQWWNYYIQRSMRVSKINLYKCRIKERNIHITFVIESHFYFKKILTLNVVVSNKFKVDVVSSMWCFVEIRSVEFFTSKVLNI